MSGIVLAHDGSIHADWVARYAIRLARASGDGLEIVHVEDGALPAVTLEARLAHVVELGEASGVETSLRHLPRSAGTVARALDAAVPASGGRVIVCGLRSRATRRGLLHGTVSEMLLRSTRHDVLAIRVVTPSLLGHARHVLCALSQNPRGARRAAPFLRLLAPELTRLSLLTVMSPWLGRLSRPTREDLRALRACGLGFLDSVESQLQSALAPLDIPVDAHVSVSAQWSAAILRHAGRVRAELLLLGSTERTLTRRLVFGDPLERVLRDASCDVAIFRRAEHVVP